MKNGEWKYASHTPLIKGILDLYKPDYVLELGCGMYSTPLFLAADVEYHGMDNDMKWVNHIKKMLGVSITYHDLGGIDRATTWNELSELQRMAIREYYVAISRGLSDVQTKLLFVDGFACTRRIAIDVLKGFFDVIVYHDSQPKRKVYVNAVNAKDRTPSMFGHMYDQSPEPGFGKYHLKTIRNWTSVMVKEDKGFIALKESVAPYIEEFYAQWGQNVGMEVIQL